MLGADIQAGYAQVIPSSQSSFTRIIDALPANAPGYQFLSQPVTQRSSDSLPN